MPWMSSIYYAHLSNLTLSTLSRKVWLNRNGPVTAFVQWYHSAKKLNDCYADLNIPENSDETVVREAFINLSKKYHPDSGSQMASAAKFSQIQNSYKTILAHRQNATAAEQEQEDLDEEIVNKKHKAPQHRQYLSYEGVGYGTPSQRHQQYQKFRVERAMENVFEHHKQKHTAKYEDRLMVKVNTAADQVKKSGGMARLVEDLIQESMKRGEFNNLEGMGKPLKDSYVPYGVDSITHNMNKILINNGYAPEWITMEKEIKDTFKKAKEALLKKRQTLGHSPLAAKEHKLWCSYVKEFREQVTKLNKMIDNFNMIAPLLSMQLPHYKADIPIKQIEDKFSPIDGSADSASGGQSEESSKSDGGSARTGIFDFWRFGKASD